MHKRTLKFIYDGQEICLSLLPEQVLGELLHDVAAELQRRKDNPSVDYTEVDPPASYWEGGVRPVWDE